MIAPQPALNEWSRDPDDIAALCAFLSEVSAAVRARDVRAVQALLRRRLASHLPREVREEALHVAAQQRNGFRVAIELLRYQHRMQQLAAGGEGLPGPQLELELGRGAGRERAAWLGSGLHVLGDD